MFPSLKSMEIVLGCAWLITGANYCDCIDISCFESTVNESVLNDGQETDLLSGVHNLSPGASCHHIVCNNRCWDRYPCQRSGGRKTLGDPCDRTHNSMQTEGGSTRRLLFYILLAYDARNHTWTIRPCQLYAL